MLGTISTINTFQLVTRGLKSCLKIPVRWEDRDHAHIGHILIFIRRWLKKDYFNGLNFYRDLIFFFTFFGLRLMKNVKDDSSISTKHIEGFADIFDSIVTSRKAIIMKLS